MQFVQVPDSLWTFKSAKSLWEIDSGSLFFLTAWLRNSQEKLLDISGGIGSNNGGSNSSKKNTFYYFIKWAQEILLSYLRYIYLQ